MVTDKIILKIRNLIKEPLENIGYDIVRIKINGNKSEILQIMIDRIAEDREVNIKDCEEASRLISLLTDNEDILADKYNLEISSPGIDRPLVKIAEYGKYKNFDAKFVISTANDEEILKFKAKIIDVIGFNIKLLILGKNTEKIVEFSNIIECKLILTDELISYSKKILK